MKSTTSVHGCTESDLAGKDGLVLKNTKYDFFGQVNEDGTVVNMPVTRIPSAKGALVLQGSDANFVFMCPECSYSTEKKANWYKHTKAHTDKKSHVCEVCTYACKTASNMKRHMLTHVGVKLFSCEACGKSFSQKHNVLRHIKTQHQQKQVSCAACGEFFMDFHKLSDHMLRKHRGVPGEQTACNRAGQPTLACMPKTYTCHCCAEIFTERKTYQQHVKVHGKGAELKYFCDLCSFVTDTVSKLKRHDLTHSKAKPYLCGVCEYRSNQRDHIIRHMRAKHPGHNSGDTEVQQSHTLNETPKTSHSVLKNKSWHETINRGRGVNASTSGGSDVILISDTESCVTIKGSRPERHFGSLTVAAKNMSNTALTSEPVENAGENLHSSIEVLNVDNVELSNSNYTLLKEVHSDQIPEDTDVISTAVSSYSSEEQSYGLGRSGHNQTDSQEGVLNDLQRGPGTMDDVCVSGEPGKHRSVTDSSVSGETRHTGNSYRMCAYDCNTIPCNITGEIINPKETNQSGVSNVTSHIPGPNCATVQNIIELGGTSSVNCPAETTNKTAIGNYNISQNTCIDGVLRDDTMAFVPSNCMLLSGGEKSTNFNVEVEGIDDSVRLDIGMNSDYYVAEKVSRLSSISESTHNSLDQGTGVDNDGSAGGNGNNVNGFAESSGDSVKRSTSVFGNSYKAENDSNLSNVAESSRDSVDGGTCVSENCCISEKDSSLSNSGSIELVCGASGECYLSQTRTKGSASIPTVQVCMVSKDTVLVQDDTNPYVFYYVDEKQQMRSESRNTSFGTNSKLQTEKQVGLIDRSDNQIQCVDDLVEEEIKHTGDKELDVEGIESESRGFYISRKNICEGETKRRILNNRKKTVGNNSENCFDRKRYWRKAIENRKKRVRNNSENSPGRKRYRKKSTEKESGSRTHRKGNKDDREKTKENEVKSAVSNKLSCDKTVESETKSIIKYKKKTGVDRKTYKHKSINFRQARKIYRCRVCRMEFCKVISLYKHVQGQHKHPESATGGCEGGATEWQCVVCRYTCKQRITLLKHMRTHTSL